jgi:hypothetical protein
LGFFINHGKEEDFGETRNREGVARNINQLSKPVILTVSAFFIDSPKSVVKVENSDELPVSFNRVVKVFYLILPPPYFSKGLKDK